MVEVQGREKVVLKAVRPHWSGNGPYADTVEFLDLEEKRRCEVWRPRHRAN